MNTSRSFAIRRRSQPPIVKFSFSPIYKESSAVVNRRSEAGFAARLFFYWLFRLRLRMVDRFYSTLLYLAPCIVSSPLLTTVQLRD